MSSQGVERAAQSDPDARPLTESDFKRMARTPPAKVIRRALALTQEEFALRFHIPLGTLRDWEQGRTEPDQATRAYLTLIVRDAEQVSRMLNRSRRCSNRSSVFLPRTNTGVLGPGKLRESPFALLTAALPLYPPAAATSSTICQSKSTPFSIAFSETRSSLPWARLSLLSSANSGTP